jgi:putative membrane protein
MMMGVGFGLGGLLMMLLFWGVLVALAVWLVGALFPRAVRPAASGERGLTARHILDRRYARGEITRQQYELIKQEISEDLGQRV